MVKTFLQHFLLSTGRDMAATGGFPRKFFAPGDVRGRTLGHKVPWMLTDFLLVPEEFSVEARA